MTAETSKRGIRTMPVSGRRATFEDAALQNQIMRLRQVDNHTNLVYLAVEYMSLVLVIGGAVVFAECRAEWGFEWGWNIPVFGVAIVLIGGFSIGLRGLDMSHRIIRSCGIGT